MSAKYDNLSRIKRPSPLGTTIFICLRILDPMLQYKILFNNLASHFLSTLHISSTSSTTPISAISLPFNILIPLAMVAGSAFKSLYWISYVSKEEMPPENAIKISVFEFLLNSLNSVLALTAASTYFTPYFSVAEKGGGISPILQLGATLYAIAISTEVISETQRKWFKDDARNAGKVYTGGLFGLARHINYAAYVARRMACAVASGGWIWGMIVGGLFSVDFVNRGVPVLDEYCSNRYGIQWEAYKKKVPYKLIPWVY